MSQEINYKNKYLELRSKYMNDLDMAFRLGVEAGVQQAEKQQALDAQQEEMQRQQMEANGMGGGGEEGGQPPQEGGEGQPGQEGQSQQGAPGQPDQQGSELDQHINKLEGMLGSNPNPEMKKTLDAITNLRKSQKLASDLKKNEVAIKGIVKALHKPSFKVGVQAQHNLTDGAKKAVSLQHKIVNDVMKAWGEEEDKAGKDITKILQIEGLTKE